MHTTAAPVAEPKPVVSQPMATPVKLDPNNEIVAPTETALLEETISPVEVRSAEIMQAPAVITDEVVRQIVRDSKLMVANDLWGRAQSLIASWLKGVRDNEQFLHYAAAATDKGGLALEAEVAAGLLMVMNKYKKPAVASVPQDRPSVRPALEVPLSAPASQSFTESLVTTSVLPVNTPVTPKSQPLPSAPEVAPVAEVPVSSPPPLPPVSPRVVQDIRVGASVLTGPAEEMQSFSITDWRRLGAQTAGAQTSFLAKFSGWRSESFLLYMDAVTAWQQSPLVRQYLEATVRAINEQRTIADVLAELGTMTTAEWLAVNAVNREVML